VESALLRHFSKGTHHSSKAVALVFQDTLRATHAKLLELDCIPAGTGLIDCLTALPVLKLRLTHDAMVWTPKFLLPSQGENAPIPTGIIAAPQMPVPDPLAPPRLASAYTMLLALYWRINGASAMFVHGPGRSADPGLREKVGPRCCHGHLD